MLGAHLYRSAAMFATFARAITSRGAVAVAGVTTTAFAMKNGADHRRTAFLYQKKFLHEQGAVTALRQELQKKNAALKAALDASAPGATEEKSDAATALAALGAIAGLVSFSMIAAGKHQ
jgi:hypothetical protein